ncbi:MAG: Unknown protein [uncultured Sulfurovum sp.]|uniref:Peptidase M60 domain-containing protein n=1 Tax=uncultured Sulfurovum sp. TaxID=269237 RepID=A0A6S6T116_9BACT|nr:MAG: Unknown protein [uncultured Sulfurovum sp.]
MKKIVLYLMLLSTLIFAENLSLKEGWNLLGANSSLSLDELKRQIGVENLLIVQGEKKTYQKKYVDSNQNMLNDFEAFEKGKSYWVKVASNSSVAYSKIEYETEQNITLTSGWNLINPYADLNLSSIIAQLGVENVEVIQGEDKTYQKAYVDSNQISLNDFEKFEEPKGYWIKVKNAGVLSFSFVNNAPTIIGTANRVVYLYEKYMFTPTAQDVDGDVLTFSIENKPAWAEFNSTTGMLSGYPVSSDIATFSNIKISVSDEEESVISLEPFSIEVKEARNIAQLFGKATQPPKNGYYYYNEPSRAIDGNLSTANHTQCSAPDNWLQIELPTATKVHKIVLNNVSGQQARLNGSTVYLSNSIYTGSEELNSAESLGTLNSNMIQTIEPSIINESQYLLIKGDSSCLHLTEVEVYGELTGTPYFEGKEREIFVQESANNGTLISNVLAKDFQGDRLTYSLVGDVPFSIDNNGNILVNGLLDYGTYTFEVTASDGVNSSRTSVSIVANSQGVAENIAHRFGVATQSSDESYYYYGDPANAIDNNLSTMNMTADEGWLQIALPKGTKVSKVVVRNRTDDWTSRISGTKIYVGTQNFNGTAIESDYISTLTSSTEPQIFTFDTLKEGDYIFLKEDDDNMHVLEVEAYGVTPATPVLMEHESELLIQGTSAIGTTVTTLEAIDYQDDTLLYSIDNSVFTIDNQGNIKVNAVLQAGTYDLVVSVSDGVNSISTNITVTVTSATAVEDALSSGSVLSVTEEELIEATRDEISSLKAGDALLLAIYQNGDITYDPGGYDSQLINLYADANKVFPILYGNKNNVLAIVGTKEASRFSVFASNPLSFFDSNENMEYEPYMKKVFAWLMDGEPLDMTLNQSSKTIVLSFANSSSAVERWVTSTYPNWTLKSCNDEATLESCYADADLILLGRSGIDADAEALALALPKVLVQGKPILYLHDNWGQNNLSQVVADLFDFSFPYGGNYWAEDAASWNNIQEMQLALFTQLGYASIDTMLAHFQDRDYDFDWSQCKDGSSVGSQYDDCSDVVGLSSDFQEGATKVRTMMNDLDSSKKDIFATSDYRLQKLLALIGDKFRQSVSYPMDKVTTDDTEFMKSYYSDHAIYNYRKLNPAQNDMGNFSRSDFSHITPSTKIVNLTSKKNFRSTGAYALPGQTVKVTRNDSSDLTVKVFINTLRSGATHQYQPNAYNRPKYLQTPHFEIASGETIELTSPYGGTLQLEVDTNDLPIEVTFENVGEHAYWASSADDASFTQKLNAGDFDWAEVVTSGFEVHSKLDKMQDSVADEKWGTAEALANATQKYMSNYPHVLAGFKGPGIDVVDEIHDFADDKGLSIQNLDLVKHMNADQATCGYGCSGNPYDAYWAYSPIGHGDVHELGHGLERGRFKFEGFELHAITNPYSYYTKSKYNETTGGDPDCQNLPFKEVFEELQASVNESNATAYLQSNLWESSGWSQQFMVTLQAMMHTQKMGKLENGWHLLARLHILEREISRADDDWEANRASLGFNSYTLDEFNTMRRNDWLLVSFSFASGLDFREYLTMMGIEYSQKASEQVASFSYESVPKIFFVSTPNGYCKSDDTYGAFLDKSTLEVDGTTAFPY